MFWGSLFGLLFFVPVLGMAVGAGMGALGEFGGTVLQSSLSKEAEAELQQELNAGRQQAGASG